jgi:ribosomal protein S1
VRVSQSILSLFHKNATCGSYERRAGLGVRLEALETVKGAITRVVRLGGGLVVLVEESAEMSRRRIPGALSPGFPPESVVSTRSELRSTAGTSPYPRVVE